MLYLSKDSSSFRLYVLKNSGEAEDLIVSSNILQVEEYIEKIQKYCTRLKVPRLA